MLITSKVFPKKHKKSTVLLFASFFKFGLNPEFDRYIWRKLASHYWLEVSLFILPNILLWHLANSTSGNFLIRSYCVKAKTVISKACVLCCTEIHWPILYFKCAFYPHMISLDYDWWVEKCGLTKLRKSSKYQHYSQASELHSQLSSLI